MVSKVYQGKNFANHYKLIYYFQFKTVVLNKYFQSVFHRL